MEAGGELTEEWRTVEGFPDYEVSSLGRLRSVTQRRGARFRQECVRGWIKKYKPTGRPVAVMVALRRHGETAEFRLHRLVLEAFVGRAPEGTEACHNDGNPLNNAASNLRWDTKQGNRDDMVRHGTRKSPPVHLGEKHHNTVLTAEDIRVIRSTPIARGTLTRLARQFGTSATTIKRIYQRKVWNHVQ